MNDFFLGVIVVVGVPVYVYLLARIITSGIVRSYFEIKREFCKKEA